MKSDLRKTILLNIRNYAIAFITIVLYLYLAIILQLTIKLDSITATAVSNLSLSAICLTLYFLLRKSEYSGFTSKIDLSPKTISLCIISMFFVTYILSILFAWFRLYVIDPGMVNRAENFENINIGWYMLSGCIIAPIAEETVMRLFLYNLLKSKSNWIVSMLITSFVFAVLHGTFAHTILAMIFGIVMTLIYEFTGTWFMPIVCHMMYNIMTMFSGHVFSGLGQYTWLTVVLTVLLLSVIIGQIFAWDKRIKDSKGAKK
ncbi:CPBP family intramembrane metalloprotease [bacterium]|nr:CPBP family intramembrane metalloprotease [bacterium]